MNKILFFFMIGLLFITSCDKISEEEEYMFLGDSLIYYWDLDYYLPLSLTTNFGVKGAKINDISENNLSNKMDTIVLLVGTNDLTSTESAWTEEFLNNILNKFRNLFKSLNSKKVIVISILPRLDIKSEYIKSLNKKVEKLTLEDSNLEYLDVFDDFMKEDEININFYIDGLHLSRNGYSLLSNKFINYLK